MSNKVNKNRIIEINFLFLLVGCPPSNVGTELSATDNLTTSENTTSTTFMNVTSTTISFDMGNINNFDLGSIFDVNSNESSSTTGLENPICGNKEIENGEECDDGPDGSFECTVNCTKSFCGDGIINPHSFEYCDDGNKIDKDSCSTECYNTLIVFLTNEYVHTFGNFGGIDGADTICQMNANKFGLKGVFKAWLSGLTPESSPLNRFGTSSFKGWYVSPSDPLTYVAKGWISLQNLENPINIMANGDIDKYSEGRVWTNTLGNGKIITSNPDETCDSFSSQLETQKAYVGQFTDLKTWSYVYSQPCNQGAKLYCFQVYN